MLEVKINELVFQIEESQLETGHVIINGKAADFDLVHLGGTHYHLLWNNRSYNLETLKGADQSTVVKVNGQVFKPVVKNETDLLLERLGMSGVKKKAIKELKAPMPGLVLDIKVKVGSKVSENEPLVVLEAMKMENVLKSPTEGTVKDILVNIGQPLEKNAIILTFE